MFLADLKATQKSFNFAKKLNLPLYFVSAADGTNVVKVRGQEGSGFRSRWGTGRTREVGTEEPSIIPPPTDPLPSPSTALH